MMALKKNTVLKKKEKENTMKEVLPRRYESPE